MNDWRSRLEAIVRNKTEVRRVSKVSPDEARRRIDEFLHNIVLPAFKELEREFNQRGYHVVIYDREDRDEASICVLENETEEFVYTIRCRAYYKGTIAFPNLGEERKSQVFKAEVLVGKGTQRTHELHKFTREGIIHDFLDEYEKWV